MASELKPEDPVTPLNYAISLTEQRRFSEARDAIQKAWLLIKDKDLSSKRNASNAVLAKAILAWIEVRENPAELPKFINAVRVCQGLPVDNESMTQALADRNALKAYYIAAAKELIQHQNMHGLEFMAYDLMVAAKARYPDIANEPEYTTLLKQLPPYAISWRNPV